MIRALFRIVACAPLAAVAAAWIALAAHFARGDDTVLLDTLVLDRPMLAGISGFRERWDRPIVLSERGATEMVERGKSGKGPRAVWSFSKIGAGRTGAIVFDALHRSLLVRFPDAAQRIADELAKGKSIARVELVLPYHDTELWPEGYADPAGVSFLGRTWIDEPPTWHAVGWALRRPWIADADLGPTFNASIHGAVYWTKYGAQGEGTDRAAMRFGPAEVSSVHTQGRMDVTAAATDPSFGPTLSARLRTLSDCGFLIKKWEVYDERYFSGGYEWGTATGGRGILIDTPKLVVTFAKAAQPIDPKELEISLGANVPVIARRQAREPEGQPTLRLPTLVELRGYAARYGEARPGWMPDWQWQRVRELYASGRGTLFPTSHDLYARWIDELLSTAPRRWNGFDAADKVHAFFHFGEAWPAYVRDYQRLDWWAWLNPDKAIDQLVHPYESVAQAIAYYQQTHDWTGNTDIYRPYCYSLGTMNFNHTAVAGALVGGRAIDDARVMADGRHGLEAWPLRTWCWLDGSSQESLDHYYFGISLKALKVVADHGPTSFDRLAGRMALARHVDELVAGYHPALRNFVSSSTRTGAGYALGGIQDGTKHIVHTLSRDGALLDLARRRTVGAMPIFGEDVAPELVADMALEQSWAPAYVAEGVDSRKLPFESTSKYTAWGGFAQTPLWRRTFLGRHYGLASQDVATHNETVAVMAQWKRRPDKATSAGDLSTMFVRYGINTTNLLDTVTHGHPGEHNPDGALGTFGGSTYQLQHRNRAIILASPIKGLRWGKYDLPAEVKSLQTTIGLMNFERPPTWKLYVDGVRVESFPVTLGAGRRITIADGVTYVGIIPLPSTDLARDYEVVITDQTGPLVNLQGGGSARPALLIEQYNYRSEKPMPEERISSDEVDLAYGGFVVELGDVDEYDSFAAFQQHMADAKLTAAWDEHDRVLNVSYTSGMDALECGFKPGYAGAGGSNQPTTECFPSRNVNGQWPYLAERIDLDNPLVQQGSSGRLTKNGAKLACDRGHMAYLETQPTTGVYAAFNPLPDPIEWSFATPEGVTITADGKLGLARVVARPAASELTIDHAWRANQAAPGLATALVVSGLSAPPTGQHNGRLLGPNVQRSDGPDGKTVYVIPLGDAELDPAAAIERAKSIEQRLAR